MAFTIRVAVTQHWAGKAPSLLNGRWLKQAPGAARKRDRSKHCSAGRFLAQDILRKRRQTRDALPHVRDTARKIYPNASSGTDHAASTARIKDVSATGSIVLSKCRQRPPRKRNSIAVGGGVSVAAGCGTGTPAATGISIG